MTHAISFAILLAAAPAAAASVQDSGSAVAVEPAVAQKMMELCRSTHAVAPQALAQLGEAEHAALLAIARDAKAPLYARVRALGFLGARRTKEVEALWAAAREWPEQELRIQAALSQALALGRTPDAARFAAGLLAAADSRVREVGVNVLFKLGTSEARELAKQHAERESDAVVRALIARRLAE